MAKRFLISGYVGFDNFGDEAIVDILAEHLKENRAKNIVWISANPIKTARIHNVNAVGMFNFLPALLRSDVLISGGGSLLQDITSLKSLLYYLTIISLALILRKKVIIFAQGFSSYRTKIGEILTKTVLKKCQNISVRDIESLEILNNWSIKSELVYDPVFGAEIKSKEHSGLGIQLRNTENLDNNFLDELAKQVCLNFKNEKIKLISLQEKMDFKVIKDFSKMLNKYGKTNYEIVEINNVNQGFSVLSELEYLIGMRFHACLVAAKSGVKVLGINYDKKIENLAHAIGFPLINIYQKDAKKVTQVLETEPTKYRIPEFKFPNLLH